MSSERQPRVHATLLVVATLIAGIAACAPIRSSGPVPTPIISGTLVSPEASPSLEHSPSASTGIGAEACPGLAIGPTGLLEDQSIDVNGTEAPRTFVLSVPPTASAATRLPVVFAYHGDGGSGDGVRERLGLESVAEGRAIFVYPNGVERPDGWWALEGRGAKNPDVAFFDAILDDLKSRYCVDPNRVFATGFSRGGFFVNALACERGDKLAAIAPQSGGGPYWPDSAYNADGFLKCPTPAVPALIIHGNADEVVPNVATPGSQNGGWQAFDHWAYWNHPSPRSSHRPVTDPADPAPCVEARDLPPDHPVIACFVDGLGHDTWSEESSVVWDFFSRLP